MNWPKPVPPKKTKKYLANFRKNWQDTEQIKPYSSERYQEKGLKAVTPLHFCWQLSWTQISMSHAVKDSDKNKTKKKYVRPEYRVRNDNVQNPQKPNLLCKKSKMPQKTPILSLPWRTRPPAWKTVVIICQNSKNTSRESSLADLLKGGGLVYIIAMVGWSAVGIWSVDQIAAQSAVHPDAMA